MFRVAYPALLACFLLAGASDQVPQPGAGVEGLESRDAGALESHASSILSLTLHFPELVYTDVTRGAPLRRELDAELQDLLVSSTLQALASDGAGHVARVKVYVTDIAQSAPDWDRDDDEHDLHDGNVTLSHHSPLDSVSTVAVARIDVRAKHALKTLETLRKRWHQDADLVIAPSPQGLAMLKHFGSVECLAAVVHGALYAPDPVAASAASAAPEALVGAAHPLLRGQPV